MKWGEWANWSDEGSLMLAYSLDNLRLLKLLYDAGYSLPDGDFTEPDVCAERAFDLFYAATEQILGSFELDPDEDDEGYGYEYQPGKISHPRLKRLYELATSSDDHERIENEINPYLRVGTSYLQDVFIGKRHVGWLCGGVLSIRLLYANRLCGVFHHVGENRHETSRSI